MRNIQLTIFILISILFWTSLYIFVPKYIYFYSDKFDLNLNFYNKQIKVITKNDFLVMGVESIIEIKKTQTVFFILLNIYSLFSLILLFPNFKKKLGINLSLSFSIYAISIIFYRLIFFPYDDKFNNYHLFFSPLHFIFYFNLFYCLVRFIFKNNNFEIVNLRFGFVSHSINNWIFSFTITVISIIVSLIFNWYKWI